MNKTEETINGIIVIVLTILLITGVIYWLANREDPDPRYNMNSLTLINIHDKNKTVIRNGHVMDRLPVFISNGYDQDIQIFEKDGTLYKNSYFEHGFRNIILDE